MTEIPCKGKLADGTDCTETVKYVGETIPGVLKVDFNLGKDEKEVVYLTCDKYKHTCRYEI